MALAEMVLGLQQNGKTMNNFSTAERSSVNNVRVANEQQIRRFLQLARPTGGALTILHISDRGGPPAAKTFDLPSEGNLLVAYVAQHNANRRNIYWLPNDMRLAHCKPGKPDMTAARFAWADCDPDIAAFGTYDAARQRLTHEHAATLGRHASFVIDSGNGLQAFFRLVEPVDLASGHEAYERVNEALGRAFDGPGTFNCDRIMRVPGTWNWPTRTKLEKGYPAEPGMSRILAANEHTYTLDALEQLTQSDSEAGGATKLAARAIEPKASAGVDPGTGEVDAARRFADLLKADAKLRARWEGDAAGLKDRSGSAMDLSLYAMLTARRFSHEDIVAIMTPWPHGSDGRKQGARYWERLRDNTVATPRDESWLDGWYFLTARDRLAKVGELDTLSITGFNARFASQMPADAKGKKAPAYETAKNGPGIPIAADLVYAAGHPPVFEFMGRTYVNAYRASSVPATAAQYGGASGRAAVDLIRSHIELLTGSADTARMVETWIALNVRSPGRLLGVALLVKGIPGDGKTIVFRQLMAALMGGENVGDIANAEVRSEFSGWAVGRAVRVVEELKASGHNRHDVLNAIKPYITNGTVAVVRKGQDGFDALNTTNYVCLTNHEDALPIDDTDRRWWVIFSPFSNIGELVARVGDPSAYFDRVAAAIRDHGPELRKYFLECALHEQVHHNMRAPETEGRARMIQAENDLAGGDFLDSYIADGEYGISAEIIASSCLTDALRTDMGDDCPQSRRLAALLASRRFRPCSGPLKWNGKKHRVYVRDTRLVDATGNEFGRKRLRGMLDATTKHLARSAHSDFDAAEPALADASDLL